MDTDHDLVVARLSGETIKIATGSKFGNFPRTIYFSFGEGYVNANGVCPKELDARYREQFTVINEAAQREGHMISHMMISDGGFNFTALVGPIQAPIMIWRRSGKGQGAQNMMLVHGDMMSVADFVSRNDTRRTILVGAKVYLTTEAALQRIANKSREIEDTEYRIRCYPDKGGVDRNNLKIQKQDLKLFESIAMGKKVEFTVRFASPHLSEDRRTFGLVGVTSVNNVPAKDLIPV